MCYIVLYVLSLSSGPKLFLINYVCTRRRTSQFIYTKIFREKYITWNFCIIRLICEIFYARFGYYDRVHNFTFVERFFELI